jgi:hypothetical protein
MYITLICLGLACNVSHGDKIYLQSGDVLTGKIMQSKGNWNPARDYCDNPNKIVVWDDGTYRCISKTEIVRIEREFRKPEGLALSAKEGNWGRPYYGYATQLICQSKKFVVGKPMKFGLVLKNIDNSLKWYDHQAISHNSLMIKDPNANEVYYKKGPFQTSGTDHPIDRGEIVTLFEDRNITDEYLITKPGRYSIQFRGGNYGAAVDSTFPSSNIIKFEVKEGTLPKEDRIISQLIEILPNKKWQLARSSDPSSEAPSGREKVKNTFACSLLRVAGLKKDVVTVRLWITPKRTKVKKRREDERVSEYLGKTAYGHAYILAPQNVEEYWPTAGQDIFNALRYKDD